LSEKFLPKCENGIIQQFSVWIDAAVSVELIPNDDFRRITTNGSAFERAGLLKIINSVFTKWNNYIRKLYYLDCSKSMENNILSVSVVEYKETLNNWQAKSAEKLNVAYFNKYRIALRQPTFNEADQKMWAEDGEIIQNAAKKIAANKRNRLK
jgi:hypothetical protein